MERLLPFAHMPTFDLLIAHAWVVGRGSPRLIGHDLLSLKNEREDHISLIAAVVVGLG